MKTLSFDKNKINVLLLEGVHPKAEQVFRKNGYENLTVLDHSLVGEDLISTVADAHFIGIRSRTQLTDQVIAQARRLNAIGCFCIGTNQVDLPAAQHAGVPVFNAPFSNTRSVAELVLAEIVLLMRGIPEKNAAAHRGEWLKSAQSSYEVRGKTLGIIGYGHIGTQLGILAEGMGMRVIFFDIDEKLPLGNAEMRASMGEVLDQSDVISLHVPQTPQTENLMSANELSRMRQGSILINASRGNVVNINDLCQELESGRIAGAALDVFPTEPKSNEDEFISPLRQFDNVLLTPHIGGSTLEAQANIAHEVASKLVRYSDNGSTTSAVNFPEVTMPDLSAADGSTHRMMHIHNNVPGILQKINRCLSDANINIAAQYLQTLDQIGYVVIDFEASPADELLQQLKAIDGTIRTRILY